MIISPISVIVGLIASCFCTPMIYQKIVNNWSILISSPIAWQILIWVVIVIYIAYNLLLIIFLIKVFTYKDKRNVIKKGKTDWVKEK